MTIARGQQIDASVTRWYHCVTHCVRRAFRFGEGKSDRKAWIENRIEELGQIRTTYGLFVSELVLLRLLPTAQAFRQ